MKFFYPKQRLHQLGMVLKYDSIHNPILKVAERILINQERSQLMKDDESYKQNSVLEFKIRKALYDIKNNPKDLEIGDNMFKRHIQF